MALCFHINDPDPDAMCDACANAMELSDLRQENHELREKLAKAEQERDTARVATQKVLDAYASDLGNYRRKLLEAKRAARGFQRHADCFESQAPKAEALLPAISPDDERVVDELMSKRAAGLGERSMVPKAEPDAEAEARRRLARNGRVSTSGLTPEQVAFSRAFDELHVEPDGLGWVRREWFEALKRAERGERG